MKNYNNYNLEDRTLRLGINDRRFRNFDNAFAYNPYNYNYNAYNYGYNSYNHGYNSFNYGFNSYNYGFNQGYYYNPYFGAYPIFNSVFRFVFILCFYPYEVSEWYTHLLSVVYHVLSFWNFWDL